MWMSSRTVNQTGRVGWGGSEEPKVRHRHVIFRSVCPPPPTTAAHKGNEGWEGGGQEKGSDRIFKNLRTVER